MTDKIVTYKGFRISKTAALLIRDAEKLWRERDTQTWAFAAKCHQIVGNYERDATKALAAAMGYKSPSTPQGYASAEHLRLDLEIVKHKAPLPNLFISHYIVAGKAYGAGGIALQDVDKLLREANEISPLSGRAKSVEWMRMKLKGADENWGESAAALIDTLNEKIINAPYYGVDEIKASIVASVSKVFVKMLKWALSDAPYARGTVLVSRLQSHVDEMGELLDMEGIDA